MTGSTKNRLYTTRSALARLSGEAQTNPSLRADAKQSIDCNVANAPRNDRSGERGSALVYILIAIALLAALTVTFMEPSSQQTSSQAGFRTATQIQSQADMIRSAVQECVLRYGQGDNNITGEPTEAAANVIYPINPNSAYLPAGLQSGNRNVSGLRCPGHNDGTAENHQPIWTGGKFMPAPPDLFEPWQWYNGDDGVFFWTRTTKSDAFLLSALQKLDDNYSECEADIIDARSGAVDMDSDATSQATCPDENICFRVWMITHMDDTEAAAVHQDHNGTTVDCGNL